MGTGARRGRAAGGGVRCICKVYVRQGGRSGSGVRVVVREVLLKVVNAGVRSAVPLGGDNPGE